MRRSPWPRLAFDAWMLGFEAAGVMGLRAVALAAGGARGDREMRRMVEEKTKAALELQALAWRGALGLTVPTAARQTLRHYRRKVRANRRRLTRTRTP